jgi:leader peptidase (prepilin peptidase)/N-methyltransferase
MFGNTMAQLIAQLSAISAPQFFVAILVFIFGAIIGSFLNVLILRLPAGLKITGRSHCPDCKHTLAALDLVPMLSFLFLRGSCRYCHKKISLRYFLIEAISGLLLLCAFLARLPLNHSGIFISTTGVFSAAAFLNFVRLAFIIFVLIAVFAIDFEHFLILDKLVLPAGLVLLILNFAVDVLQKSTPANSLALLGIFSGLDAALFFGAIYFFSRGHWMGLGDVKFALFLGLATPWPFIMVNIFLAFLLGSFIGIILLVSGIKKLKSKIPFGTFLSVSTLIVLFFGPQLLNWYLRLLDLKYLANY